ncbi:hypothetical protein [Pendulispora albinea]|uniref:Uncharacterized protein n=1 Tax=Pendulispora albinea TaxID=2741071 RepID=A0ABZ2LNQ4_9BACT
MSPPWRVEDEALLARLEDERLLGRLWAVSTPWAGRGAEPPHPRAAGMIALIARTDSGRAARARAEQGDLGPLVDVVERAPLTDLAPELLHHIALYLTRVADAMCEQSPEDACDVRVRALGAWLALSRPPRTYLMELAQAVVGTELPSAEIDRAAADVALEAIDALGREAEEGTRARTNRARSAWCTLVRVPEACRAAGMGGSDDLAKRAAARAESKRSHALESALAPIAEAMADAGARGTLSADALRILHPATTLWAWAEYDEAVERFVVDQVSDAAWELYRDSRWDDLRALMAPLDPLVDSLCKRILEHREPMGYLAACAHMLVFRAETATTLGEQIAHAERALVICPSHRNAQIVLCSYLCRSAMDKMGRTTFFVGEKTLAEVESTLARAETMNPASKSLEEAKRRLAEFRQRSYRRYP